MRLLNASSIQYFEAAASVAKRSCCLRSRCGAVIVNNKEIVGVGWNSPPCDLPPIKCCKDGLPSNFRSDKTCCIHAEDRAVRDALQKHPVNLIGAQLFFIRLDENGNMKPAGKPYCTMCSKLALDVGISEFVLMHTNGIYAYDTEEYNSLSYEFRESYFGSEGGV